MITKNFSRFQNQRGFAALLAVLILGSVSLAVATSLVFLGIDSTRDSLTLQNSALAKSFANACAEEALQQIRDSTPFSGSGNLTFNNGNCDYIVQNLGGQDRSIQATGSAGTAVRKIAIELDSINPQITLTSWHEVADF